MRLTKKYRIWWDADKELLVEPSQEYNARSVTVADDAAASIFGYFESDSLDAVHEKIAVEGLQVFNNEIL